MKELAQKLKLSIYQFLKSEELLFIIQFINKENNELMQSAAIYRKGLKNEFSEYFQAGEIEAIQAQDIRTILAIMIMHGRFTARIHLHDTPYYLNLIKITLDTFLLTKKQSIETFPWAAVIMGNLMRVEEKKEAAKYFRMAIQLPIARTLMALTYRTDDFYSLEGSGDLLKMLKNSEQCYLPQFRVYNDFVVSYLKLLEDDFTPHLFEFELNPLRNQADFELLENNFKYEQIIKEWEEFKQPSLSKEQYVEKWHTQMMEMKDPVLASHMAAGLAYLYSTNLLLRETPRSILDCSPQGIDHIPDLEDPEYIRLISKSNQQMEEINRKLEECIKKGGFIVRLLGKTDYHYDKKIRILRDIFERNIPVRPGFRAQCLLFMAEFIAQSIIDVKIDSDITNPAKDILSLLWEGIVAGLPDAVLAFNHFIDDRLPNPNALQSICEVNLTEVPLNNFARQLIFQIFFSAQQSTSIKWIINLNKQMKSRCNGRQNLIQYAEHKNNYVSASANMALGLLCAQEQEEQKAEEYYRSAKKRFAASADYLNFAKQQGYRLPPSVSNSQSFWLISEWAKSSDKSIGATSSTLSLK